MITRAQAMRHSPPARILLGVLVVEIAVSVSTGAWIAVDRWKHRHDFD